LTRQERLAELFAWAKGKSLMGVESRVRDEAFRRYRCSYPTAESYAIAVRMMLEEAQKPIAPVE
jgi:hypothetical protein